MYKKQIFVILILKTLRRIFFGGRGGYSMHACMLEQAGQREREFQTGSPPSTESNTGLHLRSRDEKDGAH